MKFFEQESFDIALFVSVFRGVYDVYYNSGNEGEEYYAQVKKGWNLLNDEEVFPLIHEYMNWTQDIITSDRESASFAVTYSIFEERYK